MTPDRTREELTTLLLAVRTLRELLTEHIARKDAGPIAFRPMPDLVDVWERRVDLCRQQERELLEQIDDIRIDAMFAPAEPATLPIATPAVPTSEKPKRRRKAAEADYGT